MSSETRAVLRTVVQILAGLAVAAPIVIGQLGLDTTVQWVAVVLAVSAAVTRVMQTQAADDLLALLGLDRPPSGRRVATGVDDDHGDDQAAGDADGGRTDHHLDGGDQPGPRPGPDTRPWP